ncbi:DNA-processing protein DprA [Reichenbachiella versicolor]|uniref:DNA-processing protein DprA n=1 Tax=Reichenbachiella versicolor TaxID=1821036 RepID=UPI000D6EA597|nr:DNA-processing protein DprA [Reichenbachiella versicolor]
MSIDFLHIIALKSVSGVGDVIAKQLISYCGSAEAVFNETKGNLRKIPQIGDKVIDALKSNEILENAEKSVYECENQGVEIIPYYHKDYPEKLKLINDSPLLVYYKGVKSYQNRKVVGIVGTRNATSYGKEITERIVESLVSHDVLISSGLAYGIDITAHRAALKYNLPTVGVLAGGVDWIYPAIHRKSSDEMQMTGGIMSEQPIGTQPDAHLFPARNRIIAGMSDVLIVVEAAKKGGALITANIAHSYNREVFAVPGNLNSPHSEGCNHLIRNQKANIFTRVEDIEYLMNWDKQGEKVVNMPAFDFSGLSEKERSVLTVLSDFHLGLHLDELSWKTQISVNQVVSLLLNLEFAGLVNSLPGKIYQIKK